jgi:hypothetical protein
MAAPARRTPVRALVRAVVLVAGLSVALAVGACAEPAGQVDLVAASAAAAQLVSPVDGQVVKLDTEGLTKVRGFTLRTNAGQVLAFRLGVLDNGAQFPPSHLAEHMATGSPVRVTFRVEDGVPVVYRVEDAPAP